MKCLRCNSGNTKITKEIGVTGFFKNYVCLDCGHEWVYDSRPFDDIMIRNLAKHQEGLKAVNDVIKRGKDNAKVYQM